MQLHVPHVSYQMLHLARHGVYPCRESAEFPSWNSGRPFVLPCAAELIVHLTMTLADKQHLQMQCTCSACHSPVLLGTSASAPAYALSVTYANTQAWWGWTKL